MVLLALGLTALPITLYTAQIFYAQLNKEMRRAVEATKEERREIKQALCEYVRCLLTSLRKVPGYHGHVYRYQGSNKQYMNQQWQEENGHRLQDMASERQKILRGVVASADLVIRVMLLRDRKSCMGLCLHV